MKKWMYHAVFAVICLGVLAFLLRAPEVTTPRIPKDADHSDRKNYERCPTCHGAGSASPMPADHSDQGQIRPDRVKCYFCHKPRDG